MSKTIKKLLILLFSTCLTLLSASVHAQFTIKGQVVEQGSNLPVPFASVYFEGTTIGTLTNNNGLFSITIDDYKGKTLVAKFTGYEHCTKKLNNSNYNKKIILKLKESSTELEEVVIKSKKWENPAWEILRNVQKHKDDNDTRDLKSYEYKSYTKSDIWVGNVNENFKKKKVVSDILDSFEDFEPITDERGQPVIPIFSSEVSSTIYYIKNPDAKTELIEKSRIRSVGPDDSEMISQIVGSSFIDFNLYQNSFIFFGKQFISPITSEWRNYYDYTLQPKKISIDGIDCHKIDFEPRREEDLAFTGTMYIADSAHQFALVKWDAKLNKEANINFVDSVHLMQVYEPILKDNQKTGWLPKKQDFIISIGKIADKWAKVKLNIKIRNSDFIVNQPKARKFYDQPVIMDPDALNGVNDEKYWETQRPEQLTTKDQQIFSMIDSAESTPRVKIISSVGDMITSGHKKFGPIELGPIPFLYAFNSVEDHRFQLGFQTNNEFSKKWSFNGFLAYGTKDKEFKYGGQARYIINRKHWALIGASYYNDLRRVSVNQANFNSRPLFLAALRWGDMRYPYMEKNASIWYEKDITRGFNVMTKLTHRIIDPLFPYKQEGDFENNTPVYDQLVGTEAYVKLTYGLGHRYVTNRANYRKLVAQDNRPRISFDYTIGIPNVLNSNYSYQQIRLGLDQKANIGKFGTSSYVLQGGFILTEAPFPFLAMPFGNNVPLLYNRYAFNLMDLGEFVGDRWASLQLMHRFDGNILNRIPLIKKLGWRTVGICNIMYGDLSSKNANQAVRPQLLDGEQYDPNREAKALDPSTPYVEIGTGVENIFKVLRVYTIWRTTYHTPTSNNFGVYVAFGVSF
ncbi:carboxypeptidase-like regulatory domain-containing protein [Flammeovirga yaeyamensis]|uniref:Carboxypeptidase-like regulatory domain-containing protein n=1 Tax=Flammeovirga yaeyamensis TaxID=367791 RepID=A0AAX1MZJ0_9BACT|nr:DUF5686 and carboxypeptidase-like regulatory domain-containing protein [Flammeovirga yaeyamensis]MBB3700911.1 hypothetical protein [Flammeovirga yaeyamensis]NMF38019.1 carboxypeptidase-like regulatory domain-containing protein [Flammeovirga yaeyamensis]QWG00669.1 carboxypeptidase-like regulatory domain-containing protein [Flammeovirga yaeyamensis]